jgi:hypothetical protein
MRVWISKIIPYDNVPTDMMHFHVSFADETERYHRSCEVVVFVDKRTTRGIHSLKEEAVEKAYEFLNEVVSLHALPEPPPEGMERPLHS